MMPWWAVTLLVFGVNALLWGTAGLLRLADEATAAWRRRARRRARPKVEVPAVSAVPVEVPVEVPAVPAVPDAGGAVRPLTVADVAVLMPAYNEALVIGDSLRAIMELVPAANVHVISDGSTDDTAEIARAAGAQTLSTFRNVGKAGALAEGISRFKLIERFEVVLLLDADTRVQPGYFAAALPLFDSPEIVAVAGCVRTAWDRELSFAGRLLTGYRQRIYAIGQRVLKFGQTWQRLNATHIVPGFASMYRTRVLPLIELNPPGLVIEDFNMTFEVYRKKLGKVGFSLGAVAVTQDPDNLSDYVRQTKRWAVGLWQTVRLHPPRRDLFTVMLGLMLSELVTSCVMFLLLPPILLVFAAPHLIAGALAWPGLGELHALVEAHLTILSLAFGVAVPDLALTCVVATVERRPALLLLGPFFPFLRLLDAAIGIYALPVGWLGRSDGRWKSPARRAVPGGSAA